MEEMVDKNFSEHGDAVTLLRDEVARNKTKKNL